MADDVNFDSFDNLQDLDWSELEGEIKDDSPAGGSPSAPSEEVFPGMGGSAAPAKAHAGGEGMDISYLMDVNLEVTVEVGRRNAYIDELLNYNNGSIIELGKLVGEPLDLLVNGQRVARGEVVVVNEKFALRITEVIDPHDRMALL
ncbi:MAG: flagellar motor switch protein FliN [Deltaproteobacteria bacterium]|nr:flagellar motor switch protein FliN [Deltaproteobacteria bacterium]